MTNKEAHETIAAEKMKIFLLEVVPLVELPNEHLQEIVCAFRQGDQTMTESLHCLQEYNKELRAMVRVNCFINNLIKEDDN
jgi:hypothetical protein